MAFNQTIIDVLDGKRPGSPLGTKARELGLGTVLSDMHTRLGDLDGGSDSGSTTLVADTIAEETSGAGVTVDGVLLKDSTVKTDTIIEKTSTAGVTIDSLLIKDSGIDASGLLTGVGYLGLADNLAAAWTIRQGANNYVVFNTANDLEKVTFGKLVATPVTATVAAPIDMAGATHTLVLGTAGAAETKLVGNMIYVDANTLSAPEDLVLPAAASCTGMLIAIKNVGGEQITVNTSVLTLDAGEGGFVISDGTSWAGFGVGANT